MKDEVRTMIHDLLNALAIARGLTESVHSSLRGEIDFTLDQKLDKLDRAVKAMDRVENSTALIRTTVLNSKME